ncbi:tetratricopeptide repeat protein [Candidatus Puniceispirillum marinum]|uniref:Tetratricopeptide TPR_2 n=1 Tax=Puniceispirillum marinum (strain IMCC1322) TaxID=488538 RepID=D5BUK0_PUNMI|nr:tetratricopeptide repeat protein [Candidatus Puniceispirillum marinum]ADE39947.1 Tetratricopeptide TPR_2 [Candidatus Puniceispirillum marinum IMCC1322]
MSDPETSQKDNDVESTEQLKHLVLEQTYILKRLAATFAPEVEEERQRRLVKLLVKSASIVAIGVSALVGSWEFGVYLKETWDVRSMANDYAQVGVRLYYDENNSAVAKKFIGKALELQPGNAEYLFLDAYIDGMSSVRDLFNLDRPYDASELNSAYEALAKSVFLEQQQPDSAEPYILRGQIYAALKDNERALETLNHAITIEPENDFALMRLGVINYNAGNVEQAEYHLDEALSINSNSKWALLWKGVIASDGREFEKSKRHFSEALDIDPRFDMAHYNLGWAYLGAKKKDYENAEKSFRKALSLNPDFKEAFYGLGMVFGYQNQYSVSKEYLSKAIDIDDRFFTAWKWRGIVNDELGLYDQALTDFSSAISINPSNSDIYMRRARVSLKTEAYDESLVDLLLAKKYNPKNARIYLYLGQLYLKLNQLDASRDAIETALSLKKNYSDAYSLKADILIAEGLFEEAIMALSNAVDSTKYRRERFYIKRANLKFKLELFDEAYEDYVLARDDNPNNSEAWLGEFNALIKRNDKGQAEKALKEYIKLKPSDDKIQSYKKLLD